MQTQASVKDLMDCEVTDSSGHKVGTIKQVYLNDVSGEPEWVRVHTGRFGTKEAFVPLADARHTGDALAIPYDKDKVKHAPAVDADQHLSREQVADLYRYYGLRAPQQSETIPGQVGTAREGRTQAARGRGKAKRGQGGADEQAMGEQAGREERPDEHMSGEQMSGEQVQEDRMSRAGRRRAKPESDPGAKAESMQAAHGRVAGERGTTGAADDDGMVELTLSEERLRVGTERHESERVRLRKRIEIEQVERTVPVYREELRIEREPIAEGEAGVASGDYRIGEDEREFILHAERPVIAKETVPVERIRVRAERIAGEQTVRDEVRRERMDVSHGAGEDMPTSRSGQSDLSGQQAAQEGMQSEERSSGRHERR